MGRKGRIWCAVLIATASGCTEMSETESRDVEIVLEKAVPPTRAADPDEELVSDLAIMIFGSDGTAEEQIRMSAEALAGKESLRFATRLLKGKTYRIYAWANTGQHLKAGTLDELKDLKVHLAYPDEYRAGIPMAGHIESIRIDDRTSEIRIPLERLMSKISLRIDRGGLSDDTSMNVVYARIGNCPKSAYLFQDNRLTDKDGSFAAGFSRNELECSVLNSNTGNGISGELSLYMLENMQGRFSEGEISDDDSKIFSGNDSRKDVCSYVELGLDYISPVMYSDSRPLIYRFYLGNDRNNLDVERNCHYRITVIPEDDGLSYDSWRVDKSGLKERSGGVFFRMSPSGFIQGNPGDVIHVRCDYHPDVAPFDIGMEELEYDSSRGIYDYVIDEDAKGVRITLKSPGTGILYMSAGEPVNETGMLMIEVNNIKNDIE